MMRRVLPILLIVAGSCSTEPTTIAGTLFCPTGGSGAHTTLADAVAAASAGGQIVICNGTFDLDNPVINKPLTIRSQHPGGAIIGNTDTLVQAQRGRPAIRVDGVSSGVVRFVDLTFQVRGRGVLLGGVTASGTDTTGTFDQVVFDSVTFTGLNYTASIGVMVQPSSTAAPKVEFVRSTASDLMIGIYVVGAVEATTHFSTFNRNSVAGPDYSFGNVSLSNSFGSITDNVLHQCAKQGCIRMPTGGSVLVTRNTMDGTPGDTTLGGIVVIRSGVSGRADAVTITDNTINGATNLGGTGVRAWTFDNGVLIQDPSTTQHLVAGNHINSVYLGLYANGEVKATDNVINQATFGVGQSSLHTLLFNHNDVIGTTTAFQAPGGPGNYTCNWWGQASGPIVLQGANPSLYTPFATASIVGKSAACI